MTRSALLAALAALAAPAAVGVSLLSPASAWRSDLLPANDSRPAVQRNGQVWQLPETAYAGFRRGGQPLAAGVPCRVFKVRPNGSNADISNALQSAVDAAGKMGGGVARLPAGRFRLAKPVSVAHNNVAIEGAGSGATELIVPADFALTNQWRDAALVLGRRWPKETRSNWWDGAPVLTRLAETAARGSHSVAVQNGNQLKADQWIVLVQPLWQAASNAWAGGHWALDDPQLQFVYLRQITGISGRTVTLDAPLPIALDPANAPVELRAVGSRLRQDIGVAGLTIRFERNALGPNGRPGGTGVIFEGVRDGWVDDVRVIRTGRMGIHVSHSARVTVANSTVLGQQDPGGGGWGYGFLVDFSQHVLLRNNLAFDMRHGYLASRMPTSDIVFHRNRSALIRLAGDDAHAQLSQAVVWDQHAGTLGGGVTMMQRGRFSGGAYTTATQSVIWNSAGDGLLGGWNGGRNYLQAGAKAPLYVIGGQEPAYAVQGRLVDGKLRPLTDSARDDIWAQGVQRTGLEPESLYLAQLRARTGTTPPRYRQHCRDGRFRRAAQTVPRHPEDTEPSRLWFNGDHQGAVPIFDNRCPSTAASGCNADVPTSRSGDAARAWLSGKLGNPALRLRGRPADYQSNAVLRLWLKTSSDTLTFRLALSLSELPEYTEQRSAAVRLGPFPPGQWMPVTVPLSKLGGLARYNAAMLTSDAQAGWIMLDDVWIRPKSPKAGR